jgi:hypothetical protein
MLSLLVGAFGFRTTFSLSFETILPPLFDGAPSLTVPLPTIVPVKRDFFDADISVTMPQAGTANSFTAKIYGMGNDIFALLQPLKTLVHISLGYADGDSSEVISGILQTKKFSLPSGEGFYMAELTGVDAVFDKLQNPPKKISYTSSNESIGAIAKAICGKAGVPAQITADGSTPKALTFNDVTPLAALQALADRGQFTLQVKDGKVWLGAPADIGADHPIPFTDGGTGSPITARGAGSAGGALDGQDFDMAGDPTLRPNDTVVLGTDKYRIQSVVHSLARDSGYRCTGRALSPDAGHVDQQTAGRAGAALVARTIRDNLNGREQNRPAVSAAQIDDYTAGQHTASLQVGTASTPDMANPTVEAPLRDEPATLIDKPMASPFAFDKCGLIVPVYAKMRALLVHGWHEPNDAVVDGFLWSAEMTPPPNQAGDYWLCLPTQISNGLPSGPAANDLIDASGHRIIALKGMIIAVGAGLLKNVGERPSPPTDESLTVQTDQGAKITLTGAQIELTDGQVKVTIANGKVSIGN